MSQLLLKAIQLKKNFTYPEKFEIIKGIDLELHEGQTIAIMGSSGEGKSSLLHILGTLEPATAGELYICGSKVKPSLASQIRLSHIGFVFQSYHLLADYTALQNVLIPAQIARQPISKGSKALSRAYQLLSHVGLSHRSHFPTKLLSGGEKQRVAIARALMNNPQILLADEPSGNLDGLASKEIHKLLIDTAKIHRKGLIVVTHDPNLATLCDLQYTLREGLLYPRSESNEQAIP
jgi:lipoprotein-releasing system ATP-binding protein